MPKTENTRPAIPIERRDSSGRAVKENLTLSDRPVMILRELTRGLTIADIGRVLRYSHSTVRQESSDRHLVRRDPMSAQSGQLQLLAYGPQPCMAAGWVESARILLTDALINEGVAVEVRGVDSETL